MSDTLSQELFQSHQEDPKSPPPPPQTFLPLSKFSNIKPFATEDESTYLSHTSYASSEVSQTKYFSVREQPSSTSTVPEHDDTHYLHQSMEELQLSLSSSSSSNHCTSVYPEHDMVPSLGEPLDDLKLKAPTDVCIIAQNTPGGNSQVQEATGPLCLEYGILPRSWGRRYLPFRDKCGLVRS